jgi:hypothetical protein
MLGSLNHVAPRAGERPAKCFSPGAGGRIIEQPSAASHLEGELIRTTCMTFRRDSPHVPFSKVPVRHGPSKPPSELSAAYRLSAGTGDLISIASRLTRFLDICIIVPRLRTRAVRAPVKREN